MTRTNRDVSSSFCVFAHVDEVVPGCWRVAASWLFSPCLCHMLDVADRSELIVARNEQSLFAGLCTIHVSVSRLRPRSEFVPSWVCRIPPCPQHVVLNTSVSWQDRLWQNAAECDTHCELIAGSVNNSHESESHRESEFISTCHHLHYVLHFIVL